MKLILRKLVSNYAVVVVLGLPNLAITASALTLLSEYFHMFPLFAYLVGQMLSVTYTVLTSMFFKANFKAFGRTYNYAHQKHPTTEPKKVDPPAS